MTHSDTRNNVELTVCDKENKEHSRLNILIITSTEQCTKLRVAVDMDIHGYIHGYIHVWISDFGNIHGYLWILMDIFM